MEYPLYYVVFQSYSLIDSLMYSRIFFIILNYFCFCRPTAPLAGSASLPFSAAAISRLQAASERQHNLSHVHHRQMRRRQRLRQRLELMRRRYNVGENPRVLPEGSTLPPASSRLSEAERELLTDAERELGGEDIIFSIR